MNRSYYAIIPANIRYDKTLPPLSRLLYGEITALCNQEGYCWATNEYFAQLYGVSERTITDWIKKLELKNHIKTVIETKRYEDGTVKKIRRIHIEVSQQNHIEVSLQNHIEVSQQNHIEVSLQNHIEENFRYNNTYSNNTYSNNTKENNNTNVLLKESELFQKFWASYPKKMDKQKCMKWFEKNKPNEELVDLMIKQLNLAKKTKQWKDENGQYIPYPYTWLNNKGWENEYVETEEEQHSYTPRTRVVEINGCKAFEIY